MLKIMIQFFIVTKVLIVTLLINEYLKHFKV